LLKSAEDRCEVAVVSPGDLELASSLKLKTASTDERSEIKLLSLDDRLENCSGNSALEIVVKDSADEHKVVELAERGVRYFLISCPNWKIIPLENLIARIRNKATLLAEVSSISDAKVALHTLELGVDGVVITPNSPSEIEEIDSFLKQLNDKIPLVKGRVVSIKPIGLGARVCVDTIELMTPGEGLLVGSQSSGLVLVEAEVHNNPHVEPRPFRVNAGPVSSYVLTPGHKTRYLSELKAGDEITIVDRAGRTRQGHVGRVKIERRPMLLIETEADERSYSLIVQNAETVRLVSDENSRAISELKAGDEVLIRIEEGGRHFGTLVTDEMVIER
jgi:3-dehydroquinate synthase II